MRTTATRRPCSTRSPAPRKRIQTLTTLVSEIDAAIGRRRDTRGDAFTMTLDGVTYGKRSHAGNRLMQFIQREITALTGSGHPRYQTRPGHLGGFDLTATTQRILGTSQVTLALEVSPNPRYLAATDLADTDASGLIIRLENGSTALRQRRPGPFKRSTACAARLIMPARTLGSHFSKLNGLPQPAIECER